LTPGLLIRARRDADVLVLCYHALSPSWEAELSVTPAAFERQLAHLIGRGWRPAAFTEAILNPPAPRTLAITFDDAFASVKVHAVPILSHFGAPATVFAPTAYLSGGASLSWPGIDRWQGTRHAGELAAMDWSDLGELMEIGWEIGSHTCTHPHLTRLDDQALELELSDSREECTRRLGIPCNTIAYPYGDVDERVAAAARRVGYLSGAMLSRGLQHVGPYHHPRVGIYHDDVWWRFRVKAARPVRDLRASKHWSLGRGPS
jgi:peptidoglycan/xylan/chitin deacetylase (PgdA/CDA1 family)